MSLQKKFVGVCVQKNLCCAFVVIFVHSVHVDMFSFHSKHCILYTSITRRKGGVSHGKKTTRCKTQTSETTTSTTKGGSPTQTSETKESCSPKATLVFQLEETKRPPLDGGLLLLRITTLLPSPPLTGGICTLSLLGSEFQLLFVGCGQHAPFGAV